MSSSILQNNDVGRDTATVTRWQFLAESMSGISGAKNNLEIRNLCYNSVFRLFNPSFFIGLVFESSNHRVVFDTSDEDQIPTPAYIDDDLNHFLEAHQEPCIISDADIITWPALIPDSEISPDSSALVIFDDRAAPYSTVFIIIDASPFDDNDLKLGSAISRHLGVTVQQNMMTEKSAQETEKDHGHIKAELAQAGEIQRTLLPRSVPQVPGFSLALISRPSGEIGGDFHDLFLLGDKYLGVAVGDVVGKGIPGAITMASLYTAFHEYATDPLMIPSDVMIRANEMLHEVTASDRFATLFYGVLSLNDGMIRYCNAGHTPPLICRNNGEIEYLDDGGLILGSFPDARYENGLAPLQEGDVLVLYTDGVTESTNSAQQAFGFEMLEETIKRTIALSVDDIRDALTKSLRCFSQSNTVQDDITVIIVKCERSFNETHA